MKKQLNVEIGQRVRLTRKLRKLTRDALAESINVSSLFLGYIECGQKGMSLETLLALSSALHVSCDYLLTGQDFHVPETNDDCRRHLYQLVSRVPLEDVSSVASQLDLTLNLLCKTDNNQKTKQSSDIPAEASSEDQVILAARSGKGKILQLNPEATACLKELDQL